jgi:hypothetical protein
LIRNTELNLYKFSLVCSEDALTEKIQKDIDVGIRENNDIINRALSRLPNYTDMNTTKIEVSDITPEQAAHIIYNHIYHSNILLKQKDYTCANIH